VSTRLSREFANYSDMGWERALVGASESLANR
jgi:hypothetical protein